ncbi:conserved hypothetical protein [Flavobacterium sp. 9AF]|uniref:DUF547 domain-containing protein n=1 Tax=Flavobacterium sp. 9AF TaxID=2653142 RepID=UPI0012F02372|nr:DUF547 domain-containing protein [Flavobacterium sp. 9AF]VXA93040.1 conserved hypothetical protein [Flavobacterium sp. 9AF]
MKKYIAFFVFFSVQIFSQNFDYKDYGLLLNKHVSKQGNVNYHLLQSNKADLNEVVKQFEVNYPTSKWSRNEVLAYYINAYNLYTLKKVVDNYPIKSIKNINNAWDDKFIKLGSKKVSLSYIEHDILRKMNEPRIHFAINCASFSCPNLINEAYLPKTLENQLELAAKKFINDSSKNIITANEIKISEIFNWFAKDFKTKNNSLIDYLNKYAEVKINENAKIRYLDYNWNLNE